MNCDIQKFEIFRTYGAIKHFVSARNGGVSKAPYNELNFALHVGDKKEDVLNNRQILAKQAGIPLEDFILMKQIHSGNVQVVTREDRGKGLNSYEDAIDDVDAMVTNEEGICLAVQVADCVPIFLFDHKQKVIAAIHAGWRGTMKKIAQNTVDMMKKEYGSRSKNILAGIGPAIGPCCYEITNQEPLDNWKKMYSDYTGNPFEHRDGKMFLDLWKANKIQLVQAGIESKNIETMRVCTGCNTNKFYSYKKEGKTGRFTAGIMLKQ